MTRTGLFIILFILVAALNPLHGQSAGIETLTWEQCLREAAANNPDFRVAAESVRQAEEQVKIDRAALYPSLSVEAGGQRNGTIGGSASQAGSLLAGQSGATSVRSSSGDDGSLSLSVSASQLLYDGGKSQSLVNADRETLKAEQHAAEVVSVDTLFSLRSAFIELLKAQEKVGIARQIVERRAQNLRLIGLRYQSGREHLGSLGKARADEARAKFDLLSAVRNHETAQLRLETLLGRKAFTPLRVTGTFVGTVSVEKKPDFEAIINAHPSFREISSRRESSRYNVDVAKNRFMPSVSLSSSLGNTSFDFGDLDEEGYDWRVGVTMSVPIYEGGSGRAALARARSAMYQLDAREKSTRLLLVRNLEERWNALKDAAGSVAVEKAYLDAANERTRIAEAQYSAGLLSFNEWIILEDAVVSAKMSYLNARADLLTAEARWIQAKGGTLEEKP